MNHRQNMEVRMISTEITDSLNAVKTEGRDSLPVTNALEEIR